MACCNTHCCCSLNCCCTCISPWDCCGRLNLNSTPLIPNRPVRRDILSNLNSYGFFTNPVFNVNATDTDIPLNIEVLNGLDIAASGSTIMLANGNYEVIFTASVLPITGGIANGALGLTLNGVPFSISDSITSYATDSYTTFSGNAIIQINNPSTLNLNYAGDVAVTLYNVKVTIKKLS